MEDNDNEAELGTAQSSPWRLLGDLMTTDDNIQIHETLERQVSYPDLSETTSPLKFV